MVLIPRNLEDLPPPDDGSLTHARRVHSHLLDVIESHGGWIGFDRYMQEVLYAPGLGYYSAGTHKLGVGGDFITAPMISPLFSQVLAKFIQQHVPAGQDILELGAGTGVMAANILKSLSQSGYLPGRYLILEPSADLRQRQQQLLSEAVPLLMDRICWLEAPDEQDALEGILLANEVIDALPAKRFTISGGKVTELGVGVNEDGFDWRLGEFNSAFHESILSFLPLPLSEYPDGYRSEWQPQLEHWLKSLVHLMPQGLMLFLDYGYECTGFYHPQRIDGSLRAYYQQHALDDPFFYPGLCDLTTWVDFTALAEAALASSWRVAGYTHQADFLMQYGLHECHEKAIQDGKSEYELSNAIKRLMLPAEMGESVKVMLLAKNDTQDFNWQPDRRLHLG